MSEKLDNLNNLATYVESIQVYDSTLSNFSKLKEILFEVIETLQENEEELAKLRKDLKGVSLGLGTAWL